MNIEEIRNYCLYKKNTSEAMPFDDTTLVFKVGTLTHNKIFMITSLNKPDHYMMLKCEPDHAIELRDQYPMNIEPAYHMNKRHWNGIKQPETMDEKLVKTLIDQSYQLATKSLPKFVQKELDTCQ